MSLSPDGVYEKGVVDPGFPSEKSIQPYWLTEPSTIAKLQSPWSDEVDIAIIGSGMTAASLCRTLYAKTKQPNLKIVLIEARDVCSGATGRNGGHIKGMSPGAWHDRKKTFGLEEALHLTRFEHSHLDEKIRCIEENNIQCDHRRVEGLDVYHDQKTWKAAVSAVEEIRRHDAELGSRYTIYTTRTQLRKIGVSDLAIGAIGMPAATMWPYKMVTGLLEKLVKEKGLLIQSNTRVTSIDDRASSDTFATLNTSRGTIRATKVVHASNAFIGHLVPELRPHISPVRANVQRQLPRPSTLRLTRSYWLRYGDKDYDYMMQRPDGATIIGRANTGRQATSNDGELDLSAQMHLRGATPLIFDWGTDRIDVTHAWSGSVAFTADGNPFVGPLPFAHTSHQWVCGAYQGIGMVRAFRSAQMLAYMLLGEDLPAEYPRSQIVSKARLEGLDREWKAAKL